MLTLTITPKAEADLIDIWGYTCEAWGINQADKYLDQLETGIKQLRYHPFLGADYAHILDGYRRLLVEHHAVFYKVLQHELLIIRVLHEDMDAPLRLLD